VKNRFVGRVERQRIVRNLRAFLSNFVDRVRHGLASQAKENVDIEASGS
jgi:hypothetical protein